MAAGAVPPLGPVSMAMAVPVIQDMRMVAGAVFLLALHAVNGTSGQILSIMFGIPGDGDDAATALDGEGLARQRQAARAQGTSINASGVAGILGVVIFALLIPVHRPVVLAFSPAGFVLIALLLICVIAFLASGAGMVGRLIEAVWGLMLSMVGMDPQTGTPRDVGEVLFL